MIKRIICCPAMFLEEFATNSVGLIKRMLFLFKWDDVVSFWYASCIG
jgi:hypothetical protein